VIKLVEKPWTTRSWKEFQTKGLAPTDMAMPTPLRDVSAEDWLEDRDDLAFRRFCPIDGTQRVTVLKLMLANNHEKAIRVLEIGCAIVDCDYDDQKDETIIQSMRTNRFTHDVDKDFLVDKLGQIKSVFSLVLCTTHCMQLTPPLSIP
jgi:hypothetical protein